MSTYRSLLSFLLLSLRAPTSLLAQNGDQPERPKAQQTPTSNAADQSYTPKEARGNGGEIQQTASGEQPALTTQQAMPILDNRNSLPAALAHCLCCSPSFLWRIPQQN